MTRRAKSEESLDRFFKKKKIEFHSCVPVKDTKLSIDYFLTDSRIAIELTGGAHKWTPEGERLRKERNMTIKKEWCAKYEIGLLDIEYNSWNPRLKKYLKTYLELLVESKKRFGSIVLQDDPLIPFELSRYA